MILAFPGHIKSIFGPYLSDGTPKDSSTGQVGSVILAFPGQIKSIFGPYLSDDSPVQVGL